MVSRAHNNVEIARLPAVQSRVAFARQANTLAIARARLDANRDGLGAGHDSFALANVALRAVMTGASAARTGHVELHASAGLCDLSFAAALRAGGGAFQVSPAAAVAAHIAAADVQPQLSAADRLPEANVNLVLQIGAGLRAAIKPPLFASAPPANNVSEKIAEASSCASAAASGAAGKI